MRIKNRLAEKIAGEITLSPQPGRTIRKWRIIFDISQTELAKTLGISPSVLSDYESGRRKSPGIQNIKRIIEALFEIDEKRGGKVLQKYASMTEGTEGILEIMEYPYAISVEKFIEAIEGKVANSPADMDKKSVKGFTLVDSIKTIKTISSTDFTRLYGWSTDRALVFTGIQYGRSPMIAVRVHPMISRIPSVPSVIDAYFCSTLLPRFSSISKSASIIRFIFCIPGDFLLPDS